MQRDAISFRIGDDRAETVRLDRFLWFEYLPATFSRRLDRVVQPPRDRQINERPFQRRLIVFTDVKAARNIFLLFVMREQTEFETRRRLLRHFRTQHRRIKCDRPAQVFHRNVCPTNRVAFHDFSMRRKATTLRAHSLATF
jgi:hypothetical protein